MRPCYRYDSTIEIGLKVQLIYFILSESEIIHSRSLIYIEIAGYISLE